MVVVVVVGGGGRRLINFLLLQGGGYGEISEISAELSGWGVPERICVCARSGWCCACGLGSETGETRRREKLRAGTTQAIG